MKAGNLSSVDAGGRAHQSGGAPIGGVSADCLRLQVLNPAVSLDVLADRPLSRRARTPGKTVRLSSIGGRSQWCPRGGRAGISEVCRREQGS